MITVTDALACDLRQLAGLYEELSGKKTNNGLLSITFDKILRNKDYYLIVAKDEQKVVGSMMGIICMDIIGDCKPFMVLENVIVAKNNRRKGIGKRLLQYLEQYARERNCYYIMLVSLANRTEAHAFYESLGYNTGVVQGFKKYL